MKNEITKWFIFKNYKSAFDSFKNINSDILWHIYDLCDILDRPPDVF